MGEWTSAKESAKRQYDAVRKMIEGYGYGERKEAENTDLAVRKLAAKGIHDAQDILFPAIESSYLGKDFTKAGALDDVMKWLDLLLLEMELIIIWKDTASARGYATIMKCDLELIKGSEKLHSMVKAVSEEAIKGRAPTVKKKSGEIQEFVTELMLTLKKRRHSLGG